MKRVLMVVVLILAAVNLRAKTNVEDDTAIRGALAAQVEAWNRGDIPGFMEGYENSPETTFIGSTVRKGHALILERYKKGYENREQMGTLTFTNIDLRIFDGSCGKTEFGVMTGNFHLDRKVKGEATKDDGVFSLVWRKGPHGWKIVLDHTS